MGPFAAGLGPLTAGFCHEQEHQATGHRGLGVGRPGPGTRQRYLEIIVRFVRRTRARPRDATEAQVAEYLRGLISQGQCQGTIAPVRGALKFVFEDVLRREWRLFKKTRTVKPA
jgi:hypothetical protein